MKKKIIKNVIIFVAGLILIAINGSLPGDGLVLSAISVIMLIYSLSSLGSCLNIIGGNSQNYDDYIAGTNIRKPQLTNTTNEMIWYHSMDEAECSRIAAEKNAAEYARVTAEVQMALLEKMNKEGK